MTAKALCGHPEYNSGHCAVMSCQYYVSSCQLHGIPGTGETCRLTADGRWTWLVEESSFGVGLSVEVITFHLIVVARTYELAFNQANSAAEEHTGGKGFLCRSSDLIEVDPGYLWHFGESPSSYTVRRLQQVPLWTMPGPVRFQCPNTPSEKV